MDEDNDGNITISDFINVLSLVLKRVNDEDRFNAMISRCKTCTVTATEDIADIDVDSLFDGLQKFAFIEFGLCPLPNQKELEFDIISMLFEERNVELNQYEQPAFEEYGDYYYLIATSWWNTWCSTLGITATYKSDGRVATLERVDKIEKIENTENSVVIQAVGPLDNTPILLKYANDTFILKPDLVPCDDYIGVIPSVWSALLKWYGGGPGIRRSIIGIAEKSENDNGSAVTEYTPFLEIYPFKIYIHSKTSPEILDLQREVLENVKLERDYKAAEVHQNATNMAMAMHRQNSSIRNSRMSMLNPQKSSVSNLAMNEWSGPSKMDHIYNGNYYQWEMLVSPRTSLEYIKRIILWYDPLMRSMQSDDAEYQIDESKLRFWSLHNDRTLVIQRHDRMKIKILNTSPSYEQFVKMKKSANGKISKLFKRKKSGKSKKSKKTKSKKSKKSKKNKKSKKKKKSDVQKSKKSKNRKGSKVAPTTKSPVLFEGHEQMEKIGITNNDSLYIEVQLAKGKWEGVSAPNSNTVEESEDETDGDPMTSKTKVDGEESDDNDDNDESKDDNDSVDGDQSDNSDESGSDEDSESEELEMGKIDTSNDNVLSHGVVGLQNLGNTCFLNAAVQCLSHSLPLQQYLLSTVFIHEINRTNFLGNKGRVPIAFAALMRALYHSKPFSIHSPRNLRSLIQELNPLFEGNLQHDSQEALQFLLQGIHQDLNRIKEKPRGLEYKDSNGRRDEIVAKESWDLFTRTDDSVISDLFMGQYRSTTTCLRCKRANHKFDAYQVLRV